MGHGPVLIWGTCRVLHPLFRKSDSDFAEWVLRCPPNRRSNIRDMLFETKLGAGTTRRGDLESSGPLQHTARSVFGPPARVAVLVLVLLAGLTPASAEPFRIIVIPDSQWASRKWPELTKKMTEWIVANRDQENIRYVLQVGDLVQEGGSEHEWQNVDAAMRQLDGKVPYLVAVGNHDFDGLKPPKSTVLFNRYFPVERFRKMAGFGGSFPEGRNDNSFHIFEAGGKKWLILSLNFMPSKEEIAWGDAVVAKYPDHQVILLTHSYLTHTERDVAGKLLWDQLVRRHPNFSMVFCGHLSTVHARAEGDRGNTVCEMLFDWQNDVDPDFNSYFAIVTIDPAAGTINARSYSPALDKELEGGRSGRIEFKDVRFLPGDPAPPAAVSTPPSP